MRTMAAVETTTVVLISTRGLSLTQVPLQMPRAFRLYEPPTLHVEGTTRGRSRLFLKQDAHSYLEQERTCGSA